jgi:hypothetical protein
MSEWSLLSRIDGHLRYRELNWSGAFSEVRFSLLVQSERMFRSDASTSRSRDASGVEKASDLFILKII